MELSLFLAQLFGFTLIIFSLAALLRSDLIIEAMRSIRTSDFARLIAGFIGIMGGLAIIISHNVWEMDWRFIITLFGWAALLKGISYVTFPELLIATADKFLSRRSRKSTLIIALLLGCYLAYQGLYA